jgi:UDP-GlcNAc3NAcA epimerase
MYINNTSTFIVAVAGVRPQFIKLAALQQSLSSFNDTAESAILSRCINSGQHYDDGLSSSLIHELGIQFDYTLSYVDHDPIHMLGAMIVGIYETLDKLDPLPNWVIVFGDATTTMVAAIAASRKGIPVVHVEAGVRSGDLTSAEEIHRRVVSHIASVHFCASSEGVRNLEAENLSTNVFWTGDLGYDFFMEYAANQPYGLAPDYNEGYILVTLHKPTNLRSAETLQNLLQVLSDYPRKVVFAMHPRCQKRLVELGLHKTEGIKFLPALPYGKMISAIKGCSFLVTDSGGLQREAMYLGKRCLVRRDSLGWSNLVTSGINHLIGTDKPSIRAGLNWIEEVLLSGTGIAPEKRNQFVRPGGWRYALGILQDLKNFRK